MNTDSGVTSETDSQRSRTSSSDGDVDSGIVNGSSKIWHPKIITNYHGDNWLGWNITQF